MVEPPFIPTGANPSPVKNSSMNPATPPCNFVHSNDTPHLSTMIRDRNLGGNLTDIVDDAKKRVNFNELSSYGEESHNGESLAQAQIVEHTDQQPLSPDSEDDEEFTRYCIVCDHENTVEEFDCERCGSDIELRETPGRTWRSYAELTENGNVFEDLTYVTFPRFKDLPLEVRLMIVSISIFVLYFHSINSI